MLNSSLTIQLVSRPPLTYFPSWIVNRAVLRKCLADQFCSLCNEGLCFVSSVIQQKLGFFLYRAYVCQEFIITRISFHAPSWFYLKQYMKQFQILILSYPVWLRVWKIGFNSIIAEMLWTTVQAWFCETGLFNHCESPLLIWVPSDLQHQY